MIDKKLMAELRVKDLKKRVSSVTTQKEQLEKKKRKIQSKMTVMPKQEEIRGYMDKIRALQGEIDTMKREVGVKQQAIKYIKKGQDSLVRNDTDNNEKNENLKLQIQLVK